MAVAITESTEPNFYHQELPRYDLEPAEMTARIGTFIGDTDRRQLGDGTYYCTNIGPGHPMANVARSFERGVFEHSFGNQSELMTREYGPYEDASHWIMAFDLESRQPVGVLRIIRNSPAGLKSLNDAAARFWRSTNEIRFAHKLRDLDRVWDVATIAVAPEFRGSHSRFEASTLLCRGMFVLARHHDIHAVVAILDKPARRGLERLGVVFDDMYGTTDMDYLGSKSSSAVVADFGTLQSRVEGQYVALSHGLKQSPVLLEQFAPAHIRAAHHLGNCAAKAFGYSGSILRAARGERRAVRHHVIKRAIAQTAGKLATGVGLDNQIHIRSLV